MELIFTTSKINLGVWYSQTNKLPLLPYTVLNKNKSRSNNNLRIFSTKLRKKWQHKPKCHLIWELPAYYWELGVPLFKSSKTSISINAW